MLVGKASFEGEAYYAALERIVTARSESWREVGRQTGVNSSTLSRMATGRHPDAASIAALSAWSGLNPAHYVRGVDRLPAEPTIEAVASLIRNDTLLSAQAGKQLTAIFATSYAALTDKDSA
jgi:hypothetical protein